MAKIIQLSAHIADLIAAGEVVERPASVAKELVENAVDAGAKTVVVEIENGGMTYLRVTDDGCGMTAEDARIAFLRHATSKIRTEEDLAMIGTLGFRGEALAATAAVSRIDLLTRTADSETGVRLVLEAGRILEETPAGCPPGTTIIVRDLFFNTPARMKFMKQDSAEGSAVYSAVQKQALAHPEVSFRFLRDGEQLLLTAGDGDLRAAIYSVLGRQAAQEMVPVESSWENMKLSGFVSKPTATRGTRNYQIFFVNGRYVKSKTMTAALEEAYRNQIMVGRFPSCVLNLSMPLTAVDVNVHPAKTEVKFLREREIFDCVHYGVLGTLNRTPGRVEMKLSEEKQDRPAAAPKPKQDFFRKMDAAEYQTFLAAAADAPKVTPSQQVMDLFRRQEQAAPVRSPAGFPEPVRPASGQEPPLPKPEKIPPKPEQTPPEREQLPQDSAPASEPAQIELPLPTAAFRLIGEAFKTYLIVEEDGQILFIDKHAAHERILFEKLKQHPQEIMSQTLITPLLCTLDREEAAAALRAKDALLDLGFDLDDMGDGAVILRRIPADLDPADAEAALSECAEHLLAGKLDTPETVRDELLHTVACKAAIKAGARTDVKEMEALVREVLGREDLKYCPHGRPICVTLTQRQLEKQFKRVQ